MPWEQVEPCSSERPSREIVDWHAGAPVFDGAPEAEPAVATEVPRGLAWLTKPGDIVCDWLNVTEADSRGLLRLFVNLTIYAKLAVAIAYFAS